MFYVFNFTFLDYLIGLASNHTASRHYTNELIGEGGREDEK